jgi:hypothetical protein
MKKLNSIPPLRQSVIMRIGRQFPRILQAFLILGFIYAALFIGVRKSDGLWDPSHTPHETNIPHSTDTPVIPTSPPVIPTNTSVAPTNTPGVPSNTPGVPTNTPNVPTNTPAGSTATPGGPSATPIPTDPNTITPTLTDTPDCMFGLTPTATGVATCTPTPTLTDTGAPTDTARPGGPTSTPRPSKILAQTNTPGIHGIQLVSPTAAGKDSSSASTQAAAAQAMIGASATASLTPTSNGASVPGPGIGSGSYLKLNANSIPYVFLFAVLTIGGGIFFAFIQRRRREVYVPSTGGGESAATMTINPTTVGAVGFAAWLAGQAPLLTYGEKVVISKVGNGIVSAIHLVGGVSDLNKISELGTQEFLQLTISAPFPPAAIRSAGSMERSAIAQ